MNGELNVWNTHLIIISIKVPMFDEPVGEQVLMRKR